MTVSASAESPMDLRLVPGAGIAWLVTAVGIVLGWQSAMVSALLLGAIAAALAVGWVLRVPLPAAATVGLIAMCVLGAAFAAAVAVRAHAVAVHPLYDARVGTYVTATIELSDDPRRLTSPGPQRVLIPAELHSVANGSGATTVGGAVTVIAPEDGWVSLLPGQRVEFRTAVAGPQRRDLTVATLRAVGAPTAVGSPSALQRIVGGIRARFADAAAAALPGDAGALLPALVVGDTSRISQQTRDDFRTAGLTHLLAVSGANIAIILGAVLLLTRAVAIGPNGSAALAAIALVLFVVLARPSPSVLRAAVMGAIGLLAMVTNRRRQAVPALATAVIVLLAVSPRLAVDAGFALSVFATAGLIGLAPTWADRLRASGWPRAPAEIVAVAAAAFVVTAPVIAAINGTVSVVSIVANVLVCFVVAPITVIGAIAAVVASVSAPVAGFVAGLCRPMLWWLLWVADVASDFPYATVPTVPGLAGAAIVTAAVGAAVGLVAVVGRRRPARPQVVARSGGERCSATSPRPRRRGTTRRARRRTRTR